MPRLLDPLLNLYEFLDTPISLGRFFRRPCQLAIVLAIGIVLAGIDEHRPVTAKALRPTDDPREAESSLQLALA
jgi:hypothetical protein